MSTPTRIFLALLLFALAGGALAFKWNIDTWPEGDQAYTLEVRQGEDGEAVTLDIMIDETDGSYNVRTTMTVDQSNVAYDELSTMAYGGSFLGMFALGPMVFYGPAFMVLPMMIGNEEIAVRSEPMRVMGVGNVYMERTETVAGFECVVLRLEFDDDPSNQMEFALAENLPFPCYSRYGSGDEAVEVRLVRAVQGGE